MKRILSFLITTVMVLSTVPALAANPYEIVDEFSDDKTTAVTVKKNDAYNGEFTLYASYADEDCVYGVQMVASALLKDGYEITFDTVHGAEIELFAWDENLLDQNYNPDCEESGTGFFVYGILWGINNGYLDEAECFPAAAKGWRLLCRIAGL